MEFQCNDERTCVAIYDKCNGIPECPDQSDEIGCIPSKTRVPISKPLRPAIFVHHKPRTGLTLQDILSNADDPDDNAKTESIKNEVPDSNIDEPLLDTSNNQSTLSIIFLFIGISMLFCLCGLTLNRLPVNLPCIPTFVALWLSKFRVSFKSRKYYRLRFLNGRHMDSKHVAEFDTDSSGDLDIPAIRKFKSKAHYKKKDTQWYKIWSDENCDNSDGLQLKSDRAPKPQRQKDKYAKLPAQVDSGNIATEDDLVAQNDQLNLIGRMNL
ncbi:hypothetical protein Ciccas_007824 [Cichlidogyrus casuarinus]|uniref:Uncharacterized protein n=1 Tax=Cichlidogyrus casuarinus TaxID=1844966 RepID=A0ABD2Q1T3_9PLAT